jgi:hypothetical protein
MPCLQRLPSRLLRLARITYTMSDVRSVLIPWRGRHTAADTSNAAFCDIDAEPGMLLCGLLKITGQSRHPDLHLDDWLLVKNQTATTSRDQGPRLGAGPGAPRGISVMSPCQ